MDKMFSVKVQEITSPEDSLGEYVSLSYSFDPDDKLMEEQRGKLYAVLDISGEGVSKEDLKAGARLIFNSLKETYFGEMEGTPLQALEKAFYTAKEKVSNMSFGDERVSVPSLDLNLIAAVLWGKVLYVAQFGDCSAYILKETSAVNIGKIAESEVVVSSGIIEKGDVLVLGSGQFKELFSLEDLPNSLSKLNDASFLKVNKRISAIIVKFDVLNFWGSEDTIKFGNLEKSRKRNAFSKIFAREPKVKVPPLNFGNREKKKVAVLVGVMVLVVGVLASSIAFSLKRVSKVKIEEGTAFNVVEELSKKLDSAKDLIGKDDDKAKEMLAEISKANFGEDVNKEELNKVLGTAKSLLDEIEGVTPIESVVSIYNVSVDDLISSLGMSYADNILYVWSRDGVIGVKLDVSTKDIVSKKIIFDNKPLFVDLYGEDMYVLEDSGISLSLQGSDSFERQNITGDVSFDKTVTFKVYYGNEYLLSPLGITKISEGEASEWLKIPLSLENALDFAIDGNLYILFENGSVKKLYVGEEDTSFLIKDLPSSLKSPRFIYTTIDMNNIYIMDLSDGSIVVVDKTGEYQKKYRIRDLDKDFSEIKGFVVSDDENKAFILIGTEIFELPL
ncbi:MAG: hypothetical protein ABIB98_03620 [bacterium]